MLNLQLAERRKVTAKLPQREKRRSAEAGLSVALCCLDVCVRLPPGRSSCYCNISSERKPLPTAEYPRKIFGVNVNKKHCNCLRIDDGYTHTISNTERFITSEKSLNTLVKKKKEKKKKKKNSF